MEGLPWRKRQQPSLFSSSTSSSSVTGYNREDERGAVGSTTRRAQGGLVQYQNVFCLKITMAMMILPAEEDYWKKGRVGALVYPEFQLYMSWKKFAFLKKYLRASSYDLMDEAKARDKLWKV